MKTEIEIQYDFEAYERLFNEAVTLIEELSKTAKELNGVCIHLGDFYTGKEVTDKMFRNTSLDTYDGVKEATQVLRRISWKSLIERTKIQFLMPESMQKDFGCFIEKQGDVPFTEKNMIAILENLYNNRGEIAAKLVYDVHKRMCHYYRQDKYKTNNHWKVQEKVVLTHFCRPGYGNTFSLPYYNSDVQDIDKALCALTGQKYEDIRTLYSAIQEVPMKGNGKGESAFFTFRLFKNGNGHLKWKDKALLNRFNQVAAEQHQKELAHSKT